MKNVFFVMSLMSLLVGCVEVQDEEKKSDPVIATQVSNLSYEIEALAQPHSYLVRLKGVNCSESMTRSTFRVKQMQVQLSNCQDSLIEPGAYEYEWIDQGQKKTILVQIPRDLVIDGPLQLNDLMPVDVNNNKNYNKYLKIEGRLFLTYGSKIITNGESVLIEAQSVNSEGGQISTFSEQTQAAANQNGLHGGLIYLKTSKLTGNLKVQLIGQNGGNGGKDYKSNGLSIDLSVSLDAGNGGNTGSFWLEAEDTKNSYVVIERNYGKSGTPTDKQWCVKRNSKNDSKCERWTTLRPSGKDGLPGIEEKSCLIINNECTNFILN